MPTQTFFNLSEEKRERLISGAMKEFAHYCLNDASIANIIKNANISRGSFYQYFDGKSDLYFYLIGIFRRNTTQLMLQSFQEKDGVFIEGYQLFGDKYIQSIMESEKVGFFKHMYLNMNHQISQQVGGDIVSSIKAAMPKDGKRVIDVIKRDTLRIQTDEELRELTKFIINMLNQTIMEGFSKERSIKDTQIEFRKKMDWLTFGVMKKELNEGE
ncbi:TetR/AcrR family transcriptional regulator [Lacticigenium naphthae]|uniref:TetR/AcrR family transcriptional regulator n=1 Tax=Lacticigenium naphthae TaxID=515351 RepID=UPI00042965FA|nr:TetR/AcrR family transcriptional regulator [Lacticigenium naphthae]